MQTLQYKVGLKQDGCLYGVVKSCKNVYSSSKSIDLSKCIYYPQIPCARMDLWVIWDCADLLTFNIDITLQQRRINVQTMCPSMSDHGILMTSMGGYIPIHSHMLWNVQRIETCWFFLTAISLCGELGFF